MLGAVIFLVLTCTSRLSESANILYIKPFAASSHNIMLRPIGLELARRGHNVTVISTHRENNPPPNYHQIIIEKKMLWNFLGKEKLNIFETVDMSLKEFYNNILWPGNLGFTEYVLAKPQVANLMKNNQTFDMVISEQFFQEATNMLAHKYKAPLVLVSTFGNCMRHNIVVRNPLQLSSVTAEFLFLKDPRSFWSRFLNIYYTAYEFYWWKFWYLEKQEQIARKYIPDLPEPIPSLYELQQSASLLLQNSHFSFDGPVAYRPNIVEIGGIHIMNNNESLPQDLQNLLDNAREGVVYMNFGSNLRSADLPAEKRDAFLNVFARLGYTTLWKWEDEDMANKPKNVVLRKWLPQNLILAHPNTKVFIAHGGLLGTQEATYHGVPIVGVPVYADQYNNLLQAQDLGFGKILEFKDITEDLLFNTLSEVISNPSYKQAGKEISARFRDRPISPLDTAMFWIEYAIRHNGTLHVNNDAVKELIWSSYYNFDVYAFILIILSVTITILIKLLRRIRYIISSQTLPKQKLG